MKFSRSILILSTLAIALAVCVGWWFATSFPIYFKSHRHSSSASHEHLHTHGGEFSHGHEHLGLVSTTTHAHPHQHDHRHELEFEISGAGGLTEIGHRHGSGSTEHFWAKAEVANDEVVLRCWTHRGQERVELVPAGPSGSASIFNGSQLVCAIDLKWSEGEGTANLPADYFYLPTHVLKLVDLKIGVSEFDAVIPLQWKQHASN